MHEIPAPVLVVASGLLFGLSYFAFRRPDAKGWAASDSWASAISVFLSALFALAIGESIAAIGGAEGGNSYVPTIILVAAAAVLAVVLAATLVRATKRAQRRARPRRPSTFVHPSVTSVANNPVEPLSDRAA